ncbi:MAG: DUF2157 domain-containing protein [Dermatophilaceae bacterium]
MSPVGTNPERLEWLRRELADWREEGLVTTDAADAILARYVPLKRHSVVRVLAILGAVFIVAGLIWLVASNLDRLTPVGRVVLVGAIWLGLVAVAEVAQRRRTAVRDPASPLVGALRLMASGALGALVYLIGDLAGVVEDEVWWLGVWGIGALAYGYLRDAFAPVALGAGLVILWFAVESATRADSLWVFTVAALAAGLFSLGVAALHRRARGRARMTPIWSTIGATATLVGSFAAAVPTSASGPSGVRWPTVLVVGLVVAVALATVAAGREPRSLLSLAVAALALVAGGSLAGWRTDDSFWDGSVTGEAWLRAGVSVAFFLLVAGAILLVGVRAEDPVLTALATVALVVFMAYQAAAVFAPLLSGAALFLSVGAVLVATAFLVDRGRRHLAAERSEPAADRPGVTVS